MPVELNDIFKNTVSSWMAGTGPDSDIVISSRVRLARNIAGIPLPHLLNSQNANTVLETVGKAVADVNKRGNLGRLQMYTYPDMSSLERQILVEKHLASPALGHGCPLCGIVLNEEESLSIMINEEDHLRIQCLKSGLQLKETLALASTLDDGLEATIDYAFQEKYGYLTACPTNVGTGLRGSVMVHLPALVIGGHASRMLNTVGQLGLAVRGFYGEGSEAVGNIFQISNQITLGHNEEQMIEKLSSVTSQVIEQEQAAREALQKNARIQIEDRVFRAYGIMTNARVMNSSEAMQLLSDVRLGVEMDILPGIETKTLNELLIVTRPAYLQWLAGRSLDSGERDCVRADTIRNKICENEAF